MDSQNAKQLAVYVMLLMMIFAVNFTEISAQTAASSNSIPGFSKRNLLQTNNNDSEPMRQKDDTVRVDPLNNLKKYRGGFDITNKHYWSSTAFTGIYGYAIGLLWLLGGIIYGTFQLAKIFCCKSRRKPKKRENCNKQCYLRSILLATFFTILAITASGLVLGGNARFNSRAKTVVDIIIDTANQASGTIYNTTVAMKEMETNLADSNASSVPSGFLTDTAVKLDAEAAEIHRQASKNRRLIDKGLKIVYAVTTVTVSLNLVALIALSVSGVLRFRKALYLLITLCWFLTFLCWVLFGVYFFLENFANDTCTAIENFQQNPYNSSLSSILPCDELLSAENVLSDFSAGVYDVVNKVNANLSVLEATTFPGIPRVCNPFSGPPDYQYLTDFCPENTIRIGDIPEVLRVFTCSDGNNGDCGNGQFIPNNIYKTVQAYTSSVQKLLNVYPEMENLVQCQSVETAFSLILDKHCKPLKKYVHLVWAALVFLSITMVFLVLLWTGLADHLQQELRSSDVSVKPEDHPAATADFSDSGKTKVTEDQSIINQV